MISNWFVVAMGVGTVFVGLICIIFISMLMSFICRGLVKNKPAEKTAPKAPVASASAAAPAEIKNKQEFVAAVSAAIAEHSGCSAEGIRILSIKRI